VKDRFGESGAPWELIKEFEVSAEHICRKACELLNVKQQVIQEEAVRLNFSTEVPDKKMPLTVPDYAAYNEGCGTRMGE
jgi:hypothetical protein